MINWIFPIENCILSILIILIVTFYYHKIMINHELHNLDDGLPDDFTGSSLQFGESNGSTRPKLPTTSKTHSADDNKNSKNSTAQGNGKDFFSYRTETIEKALKDCNLQVTTHEDGKLLNNWILTEIDLWNNEKERLLTLTSKYLFIINYDFMALKTVDIKRVSLEEIYTLMIGELHYPASSLLPPRKTRGLRIMWNHNKPLGFIKKWNPLCNDVPVKTYISHPLLDLKSDSVQYFNVDIFTWTLIETVQSNKTPCTIQHQPIILQNYLPLGSIVHNKLQLGFAKVRGKISF